MHRYVLPGGREIRLDRTDRELHLTLPAGALERERLGGCLAGLSAQRECDYHVAETASGGLSLQVETPRGNLDRLLTALAARLYEHPDYGDVDWRSFRNAPAPLVSCVILMTANDGFVARQLIPSIVTNSAGVPVEIVLVANGAGPDLEPFAALGPVTSEFAWVSRGYNRGAKMATGAYLAFFHDDCAIDEPNWIDRCIALLDNGFTAVTPEIQANPTGAGAGLLVAKAAPLVIRRADFVELGGFDEFYYAGLEDQDFAYRILASGRRLGRLPVRYRHYNGMSTVLMFAGQPELFRALFAHALLPPALLGEVRVACLRSLTADPAVNAMQTQNLVYFIRKYAGYFDSAGRADIPRLGEQMQRHLGDHVARMAALVRSP